MAPIGECLLAGWDTSDKKSIKRLGVALDHWDGQNRNSPYIHGLTDQQVESIQAIQAYAAVDQEMDKLVQEFVSAPRVTGPCVMLMSAANAMSEYAANIQVAKSSNPKNSSTPGHSTISNPTSNPVSYSEPSLKFEDYAKNLAKHLFEDEEFELEPDSEDELELAQAIGNRESVNVQIAIQASLQDVRTQSYISPYESTSLKRSPDNANTNLPQAKRRNTNNEVKDNIDSKDYNSAKEQ